MNAHDALERLYDTLNSARVRISHISGVGLPSVLDGATRHENLEALRESIDAIEPAYQVALVALGEEEYAEANGKS